MDPLSVAASAIAITTAAAQVGNGLAKILALRGAPELVRALYNEVNELKLLVESNEATLNQHVSLGGQHQNVLGLPRELVVVKHSLDRATIMLDEICHVVDTKLINSKGNLSKRRYLNEQSNLAKAKDRLRDIRMDISNGIGLINSITGLAVQEQLEHVVKPSLRALAIDNRNGHSQTQFLLQYIIHQLSGPQATARPGTAIASQNQTTLIQAQPALSTTNAHSLHTVSSSTAPVVQYQQNSVTIPLTLSSGSACRPQCKCVCHKQKDIQTPSMLSGLFGSLFIGYSRIPYISPSCNIPTCNRTSGGDMKFQYVFPKWFLTKMLSVHARISQCPEALIGIWNIRDIGDEVFGLAQGGDLKRLMQLFQEGKASVRDIDGVYGQSLLHWVMDCMEINRAAGYINMIGFLISNGADLHLESYSHDTPYTLLFGREHGRASNFSNGYSWIYSEIRRFLPDSATEIDIGLTKIHKILLGMEAGDLVEELEKCAGTGLINKPDRLGKTPLMWAVMRADETATRILLENGAHPTVRDAYGNCVLWYAASSDCFDLCLKYCDLSHINSINPKNGMTTLLRLLNQTGINEAPDVEYASRLINAGADINIGSIFGLSPLIIAASEDLAISTKFLLDSGADVNWVNNYGQSAVMRVIQNDAHRALSVILSKPRDFNFTIKDTCGRNILHYLASWAYCDTLELFSTVAITGIEVDSKDDAGNTPMQVARNRFGDGKFLDLTMEDDLERWWDLFIWILDGVSGSPRVSLNEILGYMTTNESGAEPSYSDQFEYATDDDEPDAEASDSDQSEYATDHDEFHDAEEIST